MPALPSPARRRAFGILFDQLDLEAACEACAARDPAAPFAYVVTPHAVHVVQTFRGSPMFLDGIDRAWLVLCDSRVVRHLARLLCGIRLALALGSDLTLRLLQRVIRPEDAVTVIGGTEEMAEKLRQRFGLRHLSQYAPPFGFARQPPELERCVAFVQAHPARFVFLACGAPQSEFLGRRLVEAGGASGIGLCIGASLMFATGQVSRAPPLVRRLSLEWLYRLAMEPRRLASRLWRHQLPLLWVALRYRLSATQLVETEAGPRAMPWHRAIAVAGKPDVDSLGF